MDISEGWFQGRKATLKRNAAGDWVHIGQDIEFLVKDGKFYLLVEDSGHLDEFKRIYSQLQKP